MRRNMSRRNRIILWVISIIVASSMICGLVVSLFPPKQQATPTVAPTVIVIATSTPVPPRPTATAAIVPPTLALPTRQPTSGS